MEQRRAAVAGQPERQLSQAPREFFWKKNMGPMRSRALGVGEM